MNPITRERLEMLGVHFPPHDKPDERAPIAMLPDTGRRRNKRRIDPEVGRKLIAQSPIVSAHYRASMKGLKGGGNKPQSSQDEK